MAQPLSIETLRVETLLNVYPFTDNQWLREAIEYARMVPVDSQGYADAARIIASTSSAKTPNEQFAAWGEAYALAQRYAGAKRFYLQNFGVWGDKFWVYRSPETPTVDGRVIDDHNSPEARFTAAQGYATYAQALANVVAFFVDGEAFDFDCPDNVDTAYAEKVYTRTGFVVCHLTQTEMATGVELLDGCIYRIVEA